MISSLTEYISKYISTKYNVPIENITENSNFISDLNLDRLALMDIVCATSDMMGLDLCAKDIVGCNTIKDFVNVCINREIEWRR